MAHPTIRVMKPTEVLDQHQSLKPRPSLNMQRKYSQRGSGERGLRGSMLGHSSSVEQEACTWTSMRLDSSLRPLGPLHETNGFPTGAHTRDLLGSYQTSTDMSTAQARCLASCMRRPVLPPTSCTARLALLRSCLRLATSSCRIALHSTTT